MTSQSTVFVSVDRRTVAGMACFLFGLALVTSLVWFWSLPVRLDTFAEDDLILVRGQQSGTMSSTFGQAVTEATAGKYRPVTSLLFWGTFQVFGDNYRCYVILNTLLHSALCAGLGLGLWRWTKVGWLGSSSITLLAALNRFSYYAVLQRHGLMELTAVFLAGVAVWSCCVHVVRSDRRTAYLSLFAYFLCIHTHERYVVLAPVLLMAFYWGRRPERRQDWLLIIAPVLIVVANIAVKEFWLKVSFMTGTGGQQVDVSKTEVVAFMSSGFASIFGLDIGPAYLSAIDFRSLGTMGYLPVGLVVLGIIWLMALAWQKRSVNGRVLALALTIVSLLLLSASVTFRQEYRWLHAPSLAVIGFLAAVMGSLRAGISGRLSGVAFAFVLVGMGWADGLSRYHATNVFFVGWLRDAESARSVIVEGASRLIADRPIYLIDHNINPLLFEQYAAGTKPTIVPIAYTELDRLSRKEIQQGLFFTRVGVRWQMIALPPPEVAAAEASLDVATASDIAMIPELRELLPKATGNWYGTYNVALAFMSRNPRKAEHYLREAIALVGTGNPYPYFPLGQYFHQQGNLSEASKYYELAVRYDTAPSRFQEAVTSVRRELDAKSKQP